MNTEIWVTTTVDDRYEVSSLGRVRRAETQRVLKAHLSRPGGYLHVPIGPRSYGVHRLVALAFLGERPEGHSVDHVNGDREDNRVENLQYVPHAENVRRHYASERGDATREKQRAYALSPEGNAAKRRAGAVGGGSNRRPVSAAEVARLAREGLTLGAISSRLGVGIKVVRNRLAEAGTNTAHGAAYGRGGAA